MHYEILGLNYKRVNMKPINSMYKVLFCTLIIVLFGILICMHINNCVITESNIVLTFVGILATFVVIGNYVQSENIKVEFREEIKKYKHENKEQRELLEHLKAQTIQYKSVKRIIKDISTEDVESKYSWRYSGLKKQSDKMLVDEDVRIRDVHYDKEKDSFNFDFCNDSGEDFKSSLEVPYYLVSRDLLDSYQCNLTDIYFRFLLRSELQKLGKVK